MKFIIPILLLGLLSCSNPLETENFLNYNGNQIHYKTIGKGQELFFLHGGFLDLSMWDSQVEEFQEERKIIRFSDLGHGKTKASKPIYGYRIIEKLSKSTELEPAILVGLSWGAMLSVDFTLHNPNKVDKLILVSPGLSGWNYFKDSLAAKNNALRQIANKNNRIEDAAKLFHHNWVIGTKRSASDLEEDFYTKSLAMINSNMKAHWKKEWSKLDTIPAITRLEEIKVPCYIIIGDQDALDIQLIANLYH